MSITIADLIINSDTYIGDTSTDRITEAERFQALTESTIWAQETLENDHQNATYELDYLDTINYYKVTTSIADLLEAADLRREKSLQDKSFSRKSARELAEEIGQGASESSFAIERRDGDAYLAINHGSSETAKVIANCDSLTVNGGTWAVDAVNSDATNLTIDTIEKKQGSASFNFDLDVTQSANNKGTIQNTTLDELDLSEYEDLSSWLFEVYIPDNTNSTSFTLYWGSSTSAYWSATVTTDIEGATWSNGWNKVKVNWEDATATGSPDESAIDYIGIDYNYGAGQGDETDLRIDYLRLAVPEELTFHYLSWNVGTDTGGTDITVFGATTDVPYFSGQYDQYKFPVAHKAASILYKSMRLFDEATLEEREAELALRRIMKIIPSSKVPEVKSFKILGVNFNK